MTVHRWLRVAVIMAVLALAFVVASADDDLQSVRVDVERALPQEALQRFLPSHPLVFRGAPPTGSAVYRERVNGVVMIASTKSVGTGVLVSDQGDVITSEHVVAAAHHAQERDWVAVWFKPPPGTRPAGHGFLLARVVRRNAQRDLAHIRIVDGLPSSARLVPMAEVIPAVGQDVFTIGHPKTDLWSFAKGQVAQIRPDYRWSYADGIPRSATAIQTQASVEPGSSGGPLLDEAGMVVGIVAGEMSPVPGFYFAVSVEHVRELLPR